MVTNVTADMHSLPNLHTWPHLLGVYFTAMLAAGRSTGTLRTQRNYLSRLARVHRYPLQVTTEQLQAFLAVPSWSPETRKSARSSVRAFYRWAHLAGHVEVDPSAALEGVRVPEGVPRPCPEPILALALQQCADGRVRLMILLAAFAGLRACEIAQVHSDDVADGVLHVVGKGGKARRVPLLPVLERELQHTFAAQGRGWLFPSPTRAGAHYRAGSVTKLVSDALPDGWTCHTLRHRMATRAFAGTHDLLAVGAVLGHSKPETTKRYVLMPEDATRAAVAAAGAVYGAPPTGPAALRPYAAV